MYCLCVAPTMLGELWKRINIVVPCYGDHRTKINFGSCSLLVWPVSNFARQIPLATTSNRVCKQTDSTCNIQQCRECWPTMLPWVMHKLYFYLWLKKFFFFFFFTQKLFYYLLLMTSYLVPRESQLLILSEFAMHVSSHEDRKRSVIFLLNPVISS